MKRPGARCKGVHVKLDRDVHKRFKMKLLEHGVSMQEAFEAFAKAVAAEKASAIAIVDRAVRDRAKAALAEFGLRPLKGMRPGTAVRELDADTLYGLINEEGDNVDEDGAPPTPKGGRDEAA